MEPRRSNYGAQSMQVIEAPSIRLPPQESVYQWIKWSQAPLDSLPNWRANPPNTATVTQKSSCTTIVIWNTCTCREDYLQKKMCRQRDIITQKMVDFQTTPSYKKVCKKKPAIADWMLTFKMASQKNASEISKSTQENSFITPKQGGWAPYNWCYRCTLYEKILTFAIAYPTRKEPPHH